MKRKPNIIEAIKNPKLFGCLPRFKKLDTWSVWLVVLKAIFGLPMTADDLAIFIRHTGRVTPPEGGSKETYLVIGRRGGKSFISALITCFIACFLDFKPFITVGETLVVMCLARDKEQARIVFRYVKAILNHVPALRSMIVDQRADEIELTTGVTIMVKASDFGGVRGPTIACVVADEIAFWPSQGANPDDEVLSAIRPAMATIPDAKLLCISTGTVIRGAGFELAILITDGMPDSEEDALRTAADLALRIIYVGPKPIPDFLKRLALVTGGTFESQDLANTKLLSQKISGYLPPTK
jgi:hypothetical protein